MDTHLVSLWAKFSLLLLREIYFFLMKLCLKRETELTSMSKLTLTLQGHVQGNIVWRPDSVFLFPFAVFTKMIVLLKFFRYI